ncbi:MAG: citramalate synthase [Rickettsiales bacterium]|nr:citramalate synthase [Rickettsiales bacterium]
MTLNRKIILYDSTLRDGAQTSYVDFTPQNKIDIAKKLDFLGIDYIEAGWPGANPKDTEFFNQLPLLDHAKFAAFGMTVKKGNDPKDDNGLANLLSSNLANYTIVGKVWDFHVTDALGIRLEDNLKIIYDTITYLVSQGKQVIFDAEHFFDGYKANPEYSMEVIKAAHRAGSRWVALCDTNGGSLPHEISKIVGKVTKEIEADALSIHCHNDTGCAVANTLAAVRAGISHIQGTINGLGERCGNADLTTLIPILSLKLDYDISVDRDRLRSLKHVSNYLYDIINQKSDSYAPFIGDAAFNHKGGLHASAMLKDTTSYEHIKPELVGNKRSILISDQAGKASIISRLKDFKIDVDKNDHKLPQLIEEIKVLESEGFSYDLADASFYLLAVKYFKSVPTFFKLDSFKIIDEKRTNAKGKIITSSEAILKLEVFNKRVISVTEGNGPVNALDKALRKTLVTYYPNISNTKLTDYKVRILNSGSATEAMIRVMLETSDNEGNRWTTIGVSTDLLDASYQAIRDSMNYYLIISAIS